MAIKRTPFNNQFSNSVENAGVVYLRGVTAKDKSADMRGQTEQVLATIDEMLKAAGTDKSKVLSATIYITDMAKKPGMNAAWDAWTGGKDLPSRATVQAGLDGPALVEIMVTAAR